jgi:iron-sulfur cluster assembly protein
MITFTEIAHARIKKQLLSRGHGIGIKVGVKTTGCSGLAYVLEYVDKLVDEHALYHITGTSDFAVVIDKKHEPYLTGMIVDYVRNGLNEGFEFQNPNERDRCGCGESFRI